MSLRSTLRNLFREQAEKQSQASGAPAQGGLPPATRKRLLSSSMWQTAADTMNAAGRLCKPFWLENPDKRMQMLAWGMLVGAVACSLWQVDIMTEIQGWNRSFGNIWQYGSEVLSRIQESVSAATTPELLARAEVTQALTQHFSQTDLELVNSAVAALADPSIPSTPLIDDMAARVTDLLGEFKHERFDALRDILRNHQQTANPDILTDIQAEIMKLVGNASTTELLNTPTTMDSFISEQLTTPEAQKSMAKMLERRADLMSQQGTLLIKDFSWLIAKYLTAAVANLKLGEGLSIMWSRWETNRYKDMWLENKAFYRMQNVYNSTDNPDQRIAEDIPALAGTTVGLATDAVRTALTFATFSAGLWAASTPFNFAAIGLPQLGQAPQGFMMFATFAAAALGTAAISATGWRLPSLSYKQQRLDGNMRRELIAVRENAESIALNKSEQVEKDLLQQSIDPVFTNKVDTLNVRKNLLVASAIYNNASTPLPYIIAAPVFWIGAATYGALISTVIAFGNIQGCFSWVADNFRTLAGFKATVERLEEFKTAIDVSNADFAKKNDPASQEKTIHIVRTPSPAPGNM